MRSISCCDAIDRILLDRTPTTEAFDPCDTCEAARGDKRTAYRLVSELEEYALIHQKQILVERFQRKPDNL